MPYFPESESSLVYDLSEIELNRDHPLAPHLVVATVGGHDYATGADVIARTGGSFRDMTFPWGFEGRVPYQDPSAVGEFITYRNDNFMKNVYREWTVISGTINVGLDSGGVGAMFAVGATPTSTFNYTTSGMHFGVFGGVELETIQRYHNGANFAYQTVRTSVGNAFVTGTPSAPEAHVYAVAKSYLITPVLMGGTNYARPLVFYRDGDLVQTVAADPSTVGSCFLNLMQVSANPSYMSGTESSAGTSGMRNYGYHGFTYVFDRYLNQEWIQRLSTSPMSLMQSRDDIPFAISFVDTTTLDVAVTFTGSGNLLLDVDPVSSISVQAATSSSFSVALDGIVVQDFDGTGNIVVGSVTFTGAGNLTSDIAGVDLLTEAITFDGVGALALTTPPVLEHQGNDLTVEPLIFTGTGGIILTTTPTVVALITGADITVEEITFRGRSNMLLADPILQRAELARLLRIAPDDSLRAEFEEPVINVWRVVDILNPDETVFMDDVGVVDGHVSVDMSRVERRQCDLTFENYDRSMSPKPGGFWYDKIIRVRRGIELFNTTRYEFDLGYFMIDRMQGDLQHTTVKVSGRDYAKKMLVSKTSVPMDFLTGTTLSQALATVSYMSGVPMNRIIVPLGFNPALTDMVSFDGNTTSWDLLKAFTTPYNMDMFFDRDGTFVIRPQVDPLTTPAVARFGVGEGNTVSIERSTNDSELFNSVTAVQDSSAGAATTTGAPTVAPPYWISENTQPGSPTRIGAIGRRSKRITSPLIADTAQAKKMADQFLKISALEQYELKMDTLNYPWLDVGNVVVVKDPEAAAVDPENYLLTQLDINVELGPMTATAKRITVVG